MSIVAQRILTVSALTESVTLTSLTQDIPQAVEFMRIERFHMVVLFGIFRRTGLSDSNIHRDWLF